MVAPPRRVSEVTSDLTSVAGARRQVARPRRVVFARSASRSFLIVTVLLFVASSAGVIALCRSMSAMGEMPMPGGWSLSMIWMPMAGQSWLGAAATFVGMWTVMMIAMMLPSIAPVMWRYRNAIETASDSTRNRVSALMGIGYLVPWTGFGVMVFVVGAALAAFAMRHDSVARMAPIGGAVVVLISGGLQLIWWRARRVAWCRATHGGHPGFATAARAWRHGVRLGVRCCVSCAGPMAILLVCGVMHQLAMTIVAMAITAERIAVLRSALLPPRWLAFR